MGPLTQVSATGALRIDACGLAFVIRAAAEPTEAWCSRALALPVEASRVAVIVTPRATARPELTDTLYDLMSKLLGGNTLGIRVLPIGTAGPADATDRWARSLAATAGREIVVPHGRTVLTPDGSPAVLGPGGEPAEWAAWLPGASEAIVELVPQVPAAPFVEVQPIDAPVAEKPVLVPVTLDRVRAGGDFGKRHLPAVTCDLAITPAGGLRPVATGRQWRPGVPLPKVPAAARRRPAPAPAGDPNLPGNPTALGWSFVVDPAGNGPAGGTADGPAGGAKSMLPVPAGPVVPPTAWFVVEVEVGAGLPKIAGRPVAPAGLARQIAACPGRHGRPVLLVAVGPALRPGVATALHGALADALGVPVIACDGPIRVDRHGDLVTPGCFRGWYPRQGKADREVSDLGRFLRARPARAARLRRPAVPAAAPAAVTELASDQGAVSESDFTSGVGPSEIPDDLAALLAQVWSSPPIVTASAVAAAAAVDPSFLDTPPVDSSAAGLPDADRRIMDSVVGDPPATDPHPTDPSFEGSRSAPPTRGTTSALPVPILEAVPAPVSEQPPTAAGVPKAGTSPQPAIWIGPKTRVPPRPALRAALGQRYDVCGRFVTRLLAEQPGLRVGRDRNDLLAALTALRAYCLAERDFVNATLRSCPDDAAAERVTTLATWMVRGLEPCPSTLGPLFRPGRTPAALIEAYHPGMVLAEPGFLDAELDHVPREGATVEYVLWSLTARRLDRLTEDTDYPRLAAIALFPPSSRFEVLAVDRPERPEPDPGQGSGPSQWRVLLRQLLPAETPGGAAAERILDRLRSATAAAPAEGPDEPSGGTPGAIDLWTFGVDQASAVTGPGSAPRGAAAAGPTGPGSAAAEVATPAGAECSAYAPGLDRDGLRYDPAASVSPAPGSAIPSSFQGAQR